jgi:NCS1 family nucleobase:cation symporter-1
MRNGFSEGAHLATRQFVVGRVVLNVLMVPLLYVWPEGVQRGLMRMNVVSAFTVTCIMIH